MARLSEKQRNLNKGMLGKTGSAPALPPDVAPLLDAIEYHLFDQEKEFSPVATAKEKRKRVSKKIKI